jgi:hypothetical protein
VSGVVAELRMPRSNFVISIRPARRRCAATTNCKSSSRLRPSSGIWSHTFIRSGVCVLQDRSLRMLLPVLVRSEQISGCASACKAVGRIEADHFEGGSLRLQPLFRPMLMPIALACRS